MHFEPIPIQGAYIIHLPRHDDNRGFFIKTFQESYFKDNKIPFELKESYFSLSHKGVIRGMHFQLPPHQHSKIVFCPQGIIQDVIIDLRKASPTYGQHYSALLSAKNHHALFIPEGCAHGFQSLDNNSLTYYLVSSEYNQEKDSGLRWDSFDINWLLSPTFISQRDQSFIPFNQFKSPF